MEVLFHRRTLFCISYLPSKMSNSRILNEVSTQKKMRIPDGIWKTTFHDPAGCSNHWAIGNSMVSKGEMCFSELNCITWSHSQILAYFFCLSSINHVCCEKCLWDCLVEISLKQILFWLWLKKRTEFAAQLKEVLSWHVDLTAITFFSFSAHGIGEPRFRVLSQFMRNYAYQGDVASKRVYYLLMYDWSQIKSNLYFYQLNVVQWAVTLFKTKLETYLSKEAFDFSLLVETRTMLILVDLNFKL